jgi:hypothetical protein
VERWHTWLTLVQSRTYMAPSIMVVLTRTYTFHIQPAVRGTQNEPCITV